MISPKAREAVWLNGVLTKNYFLFGGQFSAIIVPVDTQGHGLSAIETQIVQILARGRRASLNEARIATLLGASLADRTVTDWAEQFSAQYKVSWSRRQHFGGLLFELEKTMQFQGTSK